MRALGLRQRLEPIRNLGEALVTGGLRHARIHVRVLVSLTGNRGLEIELRLANGQTRGRIAYHFEVLEMPVCVPGLAFRRRAEYSGHIVETLDIGLGCEIQVTPIRLRLAGERILEILLRLAAF